MADGRDSSEPTKKAWRCRCARWAAVTLLNLAVAALLLIGAEAGLRIAGTGVDVACLTRFESGEVALVRPNEAFFEQFSSLSLGHIADMEKLEWVATPAKLPQTCRIMVFGESAAYGAPNPEYAFTRYLQVMLEAAFPDIPFEFLNTACPGVNSFIIQVQAHTAAPALDPDYCIVYMGNNEGNMPYGPGTLFGDSSILSRPSVVRLHMALCGLRVAQWGTGWMKRHGVLEGQDLEFADNALITTALDRYAVNLADIVRSCSGAGAHTLVCTLGRNLYEDGMPVDSLRGAPRKSVHEQPLPMNRVIRDAALEAQCVDIEAALAEACPEGYAPAYNLFEDLLHFNFAGNYVAARALYQALAERVVRDRALEAPPPPPLPQHECETLLGLSPATKFRLTQPQSGTGTPAHEEAARQHCARYQEEIPAAPVAMEIEWLQAAIARRPHDSVLYRLLYDAHIMAEDTEAASRIAREFQRRFPCLRGAHALLAEACVYTDTDTALTEAQEELRQHPGDERALRVLEKAQEALEHAPSWASSP